MNAQTRAAIALPAAVVIAALVLGWAHYASRGTPDTLTVTGSAKRAVKADTAKWSGSWSRTVFEAGIKDGFAQMARDRDAVTKYLKGFGVTDEQIQLGAVTTEQIFNYNNPGAPVQYTLRQTVGVSTDKLDVADRLAKGIEQLANDGVLFSAGQPEYYVSGLPTLRIELLGEAVKDARERAKAIADASGGRVGTIQSATMGVVQVLQPNSTDVSDYGQYDTTTVDKEVMVTVRTVFSVR